MSELFAAKILTRYQLELTSDKINEHGKIIVFTNSNRDIIDMSLIF